MAFVSAHSYGHAAWCVTVVRPVSSTCPPLPQLGPTPQFGYFPESPSLSHPAEMTDRKEPPFFNDDSVGAFRYKLPLYDTMELFIETLTGTCFELRVLPFEAVISVKAKIQRLEGKKNTKKTL